MKPICNIVMLVSCLSQLPAQDLPVSTAAIVDASYSRRQFVIRATPGQVMTVTLGGLLPKKPFDSVYRAKASDGTATNTLEGFDANLEIMPGSILEPRIIPVPILMVEQMDNCHPLPTNYRNACWVTSITLQIPWEITGWQYRPGDWHRVTLVVSDGVSVARRAVYAFISNIHILNLCDAASPLYRQDGSANCLPDIRTSDGKYAFPAKPGDLVTIRAYGLFGLPQQPPELNGVRPAEAIPITQQRYSIEYRWGNTDLGAPTAETSGTLEPETVELAAGEVGLYLVKFRIPSAPQNLAACEGDLGTNFALTLRGSESSDTARICISPE